MKWREQRAGRSFIACKRPGNRDLARDKCKSILVTATVYLGLALASIPASVTLQATQKEKANAALFVGKWVAPFLLLGIYNKLVKQHGSDGQAREAALVRIRRGSEIPARSV